MGLMDMLSPEVIMQNMINKLGISPDDIKQTAALLGRLNTLFGEVDAFKGGAAAMVQHFNRRLDQIEARLERIEHPPQAVPLLLTGELSHGTDH